MRDTSEVLQNIDLSQSKSDLLVIVANLRGCKEAVSHKNITYIGFPFSVSENFQMRNTHKTQTESLLLLNQLIELCEISRQKTRCIFIYGIWKPLR